MTELGEEELGEQLVEAAQILLYRRGTTPRCSLSRHPKTV
jgi:ribosomal protein L27